MNSYDRYQQASTSLVRSHMISSLLSVVFVYSPNSDRNEFIYQDIECTRSTHQAYFAKLY